MSCSFVKRVRVRLADERELDEILVAEEVRDSLRGAGGIRQKNNETEAKPVKGATESNRINVASR